ncbi:hypothetical protein D7Y13_09940 [Corallococcus praedator]|uniref:Immunity MXAN-0049 protein domain-containing protein n=1 Tax=Corallococcus praedator TaxID=2316724 RepID=A0ABX9QLF3_9BACT|nr:MULTISPECIES: DUF1629 domain-containing protein [Corallococcus]RKH15030.1 hypothetical protein D7X74_19145 [Corallococcus sp. CA047B]RKH32033.1 hypothetical protein D7X75_17395 [Corallococcus sp. CA031C]RKI12092.1 hypothetical protein D7Y13_09940 [Corallococcus praedator]
MRFFELETLGDLNDAELLFLDQEPEVMGLDGYCLAAGEPVSDSYPAEVKLQPSEERTGIQLSSVLGNNFNYLIVSSAMKAVIAEHSPKTALEFLPFILLDHRGRVRSQDYFFVNPLGGIDGVDTKASDIKYHRSGAIVGIRKLVLDPEKLRDAPALFRLQQDPQLYMVNESLAKAFQERRFTNVVLRELTVSAAKS